MPIRYTIILMKNRFAKLSCLVFFFLVPAVAAAAQEMCELASKTAPILLNLQIGMSPEQARAIFGRDLKIKVKKHGERTFFQNFIKKSPPASLNGVRALYLRFFDGELYQIEIFYEARRNFDSLEAITNSLAAQLSFPIADWQIDNNRARIKCNEISLVADNILNPRIELTNETIQAEIEELRKKK